MMRDWRTMLSVILGAVPVMTAASTLLMVLALPPALFALEVQALLCVLRMESFQSQRGMGSFPQHQNQQPSSRFRFFFAGTPQRQVG
jgi:hypothetical protein